MPEIVNAWRKDSKGLYIEMEVGEEKDYTHDWTDATSVGVIDLAELTVPAQVEKVGPVEKSGKLAKFWLRAVGPAGEYACSLRLESGQLVDIIPFRVVIR